MRLSFFVLAACATAPQPQPAPQNRVETACNKGYLPSCVELGVSLQSGPNADLVRAADLFESACFKGYALACTHYGFAFQQGLGRPQSDTDAIVHFKAACDSGNTGGCRYLGVLYLAQNGLQQYARPFLRKACDAKDAWSCWRLAKQLEEESGASAEVDTLYRQACKHGQEQACYIEPSSMLSSTP